MAQEWVFGNQGLRLEQAGTRMTPPLWEDFRVVATNPLHVFGAVARYTTSMS